MPQEKAAWPFYRTKLKAYAFERPVDRRSSAGSEASVWRPDPSLRWGALSRQRRFSLPIGDGRSSTLLPLRTPSFGVGADAGPPSGCRAAWCHNPGHDLKTRAAPSAAARFWRGKGRVPAAFRPRADFSASGGSGPRRGDVWAVHAAVQELRRPGNGSSHCRTCPNSNLKGLHRRG